MRKLIRPTESSSLRADRINAPPRAVRLWNIATHEPLGEPLREDAAVLDVAFSPDGTTLASAGSGDAVRLWDVATHKPLGKPLREQGSVYAVAFSPDGRTLASAGDNSDSTKGIVRLWKGILWADPTDLQAQVCRLVGGTLTRTEWKVLAPGIRYRSSCG